MVLSADFGGSLKHTRITIQPETRWVMHLPHWDAETIGIWGCNFFTVVEGLGIVSQIRAIWKRRSGESVSVGAMLFLCAVSLASITYGMTYGRLPLVVNGITLGIGFGVITIGLWKFKRIRRLEKWFGISLAVTLLLMLVSNHYDVWYFLYSICAAAMLVLQPWEIWRNRNAGVVDIRLLAVFFTSSIFWVVYGFAVSDWVLMILCPTNVAILGLAITLWWIYRPSKA
jgi:hypothetical protein